MSKRISDELDLDIDQPYVEVLEIIDNSVFTAKKAKTYDEEKNVAVKAPVNNISIKDLNAVKKDDKKKFTIKFSYNLKVADFYFSKTALTLVDRIRND